MTKNCYLFGGARSDGDATMKPLLGGKGANLAEMANMGVPVPPGFTLTTEVCLAFLAGGGLPDEVRAEVLTSLAHIEQTTGRTFGDAARPLLVSVRSGGRASMPGMMDTILNLGINPAIVEGLAAATNNARFAYDSYRRFLAMFSDVVLEVPKEKFERLLDEPRRRAAAAMGIDLTRLNAEEIKQRVPDNLIGEADLRAVVEQSKQLVLDHTGQPFPDDPMVQFWAAIGAVFRSWNNDRAFAYRRIHNIPDAWGTACTVQAMVFGNLGDTSATGVAFTRDPRTGERRFFGEWLPNAQGEDVVAGTRTPLGVTRSHGGDQSLEACMPEAFAELTRLYQQLELRYRDMLDIEFTVQEGTLYFLQCRVGGRSGRAAVRMAVEMVHEGLITRHEALLRVPAHKLDELLHPRLDPDAEKIFLARGLPAGPGAATGVVVFDAAEAERLATPENPVVLVRRETSPEDIRGMKVASGILTSRGGMTSHAAVVARVIGTCCVAGCSAVSINYETRSMTVTVYGDDGRPRETVVVKAGDVISLGVDDRAGMVYLGKVPMVPARTGEHYDELMSWADAERRLRVRANADERRDARTARNYGAEGIGLCRTEHMFFAEERISYVRQLILSLDDEKSATPKNTAHQRPEHEGSENEGSPELRAALDKLAAFQRSDFVELFTEMQGLPVTIRLLDPPLHEFLPHDAGQFAALSAATGHPVARLEEKSLALHEANPMLGHRGVRLAITHPEIYAMQVRAILEAACDVAEQGVAVEPEIMIPLALGRAELDACRVLVDKTAEAVFAARGRRVGFKYGTMIELPRAALQAGQLAKVAEFFSFGTNDLTQTTLGLSRDDASKFLGAYQKAGILQVDPFQSLDVEGVGALVEMACEQGRATRPDLKLGVCGEHGGDPASVAFFHRAGLGYVSCSPRRVPIARLAAAQAALREREG